MNYWVALYRCAWGLLVILCAIVVACIFLPRCHRLRELQRTKIERQEENRRIEVQARELKSKQDRFHSNPAFVERTAREIGMVKPGETVFRLTNASPSRRSKSQ